MRPNYDKETAIEAYSEDLAQFIFRTNQIENYGLNFNDCIEASKEFLMGYPVDYITENSHIASVLSGIVCSHFLLPLDTADKVVQIHKMFNKNVIERGTPGEIRSFLTLHLLA